MSSPGGRVSELPPLAQTDGIGCSNGRTSRATDLRNSAVAAIERGLRGVNESPVDLEAALTLTAGLGPAVLGDDVGGLAS